MNSESTVGTTRDADADRQLRSVLLATAFQRLLPALLMTVTVCVVFIGLMWPFFPAHGLLLWAAVLFSTVALRYGTALAFRRAGRQALELARWETWFVVGSLAAGASWALGPVLLMHAADGPQRYLLVLALLAVSAVSMTSLSTQPRAMFGFQAAALLPTAAVLWSSSHSGCRPWRPPSCWLPWWR